MYTILTLLVLCSRHTAVNSVLIHKPQDTVCEMNDEPFVKFFCQTNITSRRDFGDLLQWDFSPVNLPSEHDLPLVPLQIVFDSNNIVSGMEKMYSVEESRDKSVTLVVNVSTSSVAGRYYCKDQGGIGQTACADLIILKEHPVCKLEKHSSDDMICCSISYAGNIFPILKFYNNGTLVKQCPTKNPSDCVSCCLVESDRSPYDNYTYTISMSNTSGCATNWSRDYSKSYPVPRSSRAAATDTLIRDIIIGIFFVILVVVVTVVTVYCCCKYRWCFCFTGCIAIAVYIGCKKKDENPNAAQEVRLKSMNDD